MTYFLILNKRNRVYKLIKCLINNNNLIFNMTVKLEVRKLRGLKYILLHNSALRRVKMRRYF